MGFLKNIFGVADDQDEYMDIDETEGMYDVSSSAVTEEEVNYGSSYSPSVPFGGSSRAISIHGAPSQSRISVMKPTNYEEMMSEAIASLREGTIIFLNLTETNQEQATRIVDFMTGAAYMCDGKIKKVDTRCYAIAPKNVEWVNTIED